MCERPFRKRRQTNNSTGYNGISYSPDRGHSGRPLPAIRSTGLRKEGRRRNGFTSATTASWTEYGLPGGFVSPAD